MHAVNNQRAARFEIASRWAVIAGLVFAAGFGSTAKADASGCAVPEPVLAIELFDGWNAALKSQHPDRVTRLFENDGALLGFASPIARTGYMPIRDYFLYFLQFEPKAHVTDRHVETGCNFLIDNGTYVWTLKSRTTGSVETHAARYRFIYELNRGDWRIAQYVDTLADAASVTGFAVPAPIVPRIAAVDAASGTAVAGFVKRNEGEAAPAPASRLNGPPAKPASAPANSDFGTEPPLAAKPKSRPAKRPAAEGLPAETFGLDSLSRDKL